MPDLIRDKMWVEKYRPRDLKDLILPDNMKSFFENCIENKSIPNLILHGRPGTGKTTLAQILIDNIVGTSSEDREYNLLQLNGSLNTGVDTARNLITGFIKIPALNDSQLKIIHIDEADYTSNALQAALRNIIEESASSCRFIFTLNSKHKIMEALFSRCQSFEFKRTISKEYILKHIANILKIETGLENKDSIISEHIKRSYPDIRKIINDVQQTVVDNVISDEIVIQHTFEDDIINNIKEFGKYVKLNDKTGLTSKIKEIEKLLNDNDIDYINIYEKLFEDEGISFASKILVSEHCNKHQDTLVPNMNFIAMLYKIIETMYKKLKLIS